PSHHLSITFFFFFIHTATTEIYTLSLHDALPILDQGPVVAARIPDEIGRGRPGHVAHVLGGEVPGERGPRACGSRGRLPHLRLRDDRDRGVGPDRPGEARTLARREHLHGVGQRARRRNDEAPRHGDGHVEIAVLEVELALTEVLLGVPTAHVVVHRNPRVPLRYLVQPATGELLPPHAVGSVLRHFEAVGQLELGAPPGRERPVEVDAPHGAVVRGREGEASGCLSQPP